MEGNASSLEKKEANEVVLMIPGVECQSGSPSPKPKTEQMEPENPPSNSQISNLTSPSALELAQLIQTPSKLPNIPTEKSISSSSFTKLKSGIMESLHPGDTSASASKDSVKPALSMSPIGSVPSPGAEEEDDEDVCETVNPKSQMMSGKTKYILAQQAAFVCITELLIASLTIHDLRNTVIWHVHLWGWCLLMWAIFSGKVATDWLINTLVYLIEQKYLLKKNVLYFLFALKDSAEVFAWLCLVLITWVWLINHGVKRSRHTTKILNWVTRALFSFLIGAALWLIKTFLIKLLAASFQCKRFFDRIQDGIFQYDVIKKLTSPKYPKMSLKVNMEKLLKMKPDKVSAWTTKNLIDFLREAEQEDKDITNEQKAKDAAKAIIKKVVKPGSKFIEEEELSRIMAKEYVEKFLAFFPEAKETRKIRKSSLKSWLVNFYRERKSLTHAFKDAKTAIEELNNLASAALLVVIIILWLLLTGFLTTPVLIFISSQLLLFEFIFGNAAKDLFEAIMFVFVKHPFNVSDHCVIDGVEMEVDDMNILTTVFLTNDGEKISYPNSVLASKPISNYNRSPDISECLEFVVDFSTSVESLEALTNKINKYLESKPKDWRPGHSIVFKEIAHVDNSKVLKMAIHASHTLNFQEAKERTKRRSELVLELKKIFDELHLK